MLSNRSIGFRSLSVLLLLALVTFSYWGWFLVWAGGAPFDDVTLEKYCLYYEFLLIGVLFGTGGKRHSEGPHQEFVNAIRRTSRQAVLGLFAVLALVFVLQDTFVSRSFLLSYTPWLCLTLFFANHPARRWLGRWVFSGKHEDRVALAGTPEQARRIQPWLERKRLVGLRSIGVVCPQPMGKIGSNDHPAPFPVLGSLDEMEQILKKESITQVLVLDLSLGPERLCQLAQLCEGAAVRLLALDRLDNYFNHSTTIFEDDGMRVIGLREEPLESPMNRCVKRVLDLAIALPVVIGLLPWVTALVWLLQRWQSPGPILFRQERIGMKGQRFTIFKYRTMQLNGGDEARQASKDDQRIFPAGRWLRKLSLDELPQFINVLFGDMSVVGPRPHLQQHDEVWSSAMSKYVIRRFIRPGITGCAQVKGFRGEIREDGDVQKRVEMDIYYLENWSFSLDVAIILKTVQQCVVPSHNAY